MPRVFKMGPYLVCFWAESPQCPGCFTDGRTIDELLRNWQEASALWR